MILSDIDIREFIKQGEITISPFSVESVKGGSYTFTLGDTIYKPKSSTLIDSKDIKIEYEEIKIDKDGYVLEPGAFILGKTAEKVSISQKLGCFLDARTTYARIGLNVLQGSVFIQPGQVESNETLEISNISKSSIRIYPGIKIVKGIFVLLYTASAQNYGETGDYAKQNSPVDSKYSV